MRALKPPEGFSDLAEPHPTDVSKLIFQSINRPETNTY